MSEAGGKGDVGFEPGSVRVLVVDDDERVCRQMASGLSTAGYQVVTATDSARAIEQATDTPPDVAIVDLSMPTVSGPDVVRHLKQLQGPSVHIIVLTGHDDEHSRVAAFDAGTDDYVLKPVGIAEIRRRIAAAVRTQRAFVAVRLEKEATERRLVYGQEASALLAHDLNNGLAVSLANLTHLLDVFEGADPDVKEALAATLRSVRRMSGLVANFVDIARFEDAAVKPIVRKTKVHPLIESVVDVARPSIARGVEIDIDCAVELEGRYDASLVERVLHNLVGNAARYCNTGGRITIGAELWHEQDDGSVTLRVANTGPQVPEVIRPNLFGKYVQGKGGKRGMGLYFCRLIAEAHGGRIEYEAGADGPCFVMRLPGRV
jgi:two-component system, sensor histidine kinase and response regulator